jgi:excisionase family DNA binding protein
MTGFPNPSEFNGTIGEVDSPPRDAEGRRLEARDAPETVREIPSRPFGSITMKDKTPLLTRRQIAERLHVEPATISQLCHEGTIPFFRAGRRFLFDEAAVLAALAVKRRGGKR